MGASIAPLWHGKFGLGFVRYQIPNSQETSWDFSSRRNPNPQFSMPQKEQWKPPWMATANDKNPGPKVIGTHCRHLFVHIFVNNPCSRQLSFLQNYYYFHVCDCQLVFSCVDFHDTLCNEIIKILWCKYGLIYSLGLYYYRCFELLHHNAFNTIAHVQAAPQREKGF